jgi:asparagine synthase (glutamine-hydrolysing)
LNVPFDEEFIEENISSSLLHNRMLNELFYEVTPVILHEDDLNSMLFSIENRSPYLDSRLLKFSYSIPPEYLIMNGYSKYVLREAVKGILNDKVRLDRKKVGFNASINSLVNFSDPAIKAILLDDSEIFNFVNKSKIESMFANIPLTNSFSKFLFNFINAKIFLESIR